MKRRDFLALSALATGTLALNTTNAQETTKPYSTEPVWVPLTKDVKTTLVGFGTGMRGGMRRADLTRMGYPKAIELLRYAYDQGVRLFDLADLYGTHDVLMQALEGKPRDSYTLVSKIWIRPGGIPEVERLDPEITVKRFLRECRTDYLDVVQIHCMDKDNWTQEYADALGSLEKVKQAGLIKAHGISSHSIVASELAAKSDWCDVVHIRINSEGLAMDSPADNPQTVANAVRVAKELHDAGKGVIAMKVLGEGRMASNPELRKKSTHFVKGLGTVNCMIVGFTELDHITEFLTNVATA